MTSFGAGMGREGQKSSRRKVLELTLWSLVLIFVGIALVSITNQAVNWSSSDSFCGQFCHSMTWASAAYKRAPHYVNASGVQASCGDCHIPYDSMHATAMQYVYLLGFKANRGAKDFYNEAIRTMGTQAEWEKRRPQLDAEFEGFITRHNYITCRGCHQINSFGGPHSVMKQMIHAKMLSQNDYNCLHCHSDIGHVYHEGTPAQTAGTAVGAQPPSASGDWYSTEQAGTGSKLYAQDCASCHGAKLEGGGGPSLVGASWKQLYSGAKLLTIWGEIHGPMAQFSGTTFTEQQSLDILSFLLQQNGYPSGSKPLTDPGSLNRRIPKA